MSKVDTIRNIIQSSNGKVMTVTFVKKDGEVRTMNCRLGVKKHLKTGDPSTTAHIPKYVTVFDMTKGEYRNVNLETIQRVAVNGLEVTA